MYIDFFMLSMTRLIEYIYFFRIINQITKKGIKIRLFHQGESFVDR